jgi:hypothetical protein
MHPTCEVLVPIRGRAYNRIIRDSARQVRTMRISNPSMRASLLISSALALSLVSPSRLNLLAWTAGGFAAMPFPPAPLSASASSSADLDGDGQAERLELTEGTAAILRGGDVLWNSPANWRVIQASISDFNHDGQSEVALLLWREYAPWPVDAYMLHPGRISDFHDGDNQSCHMILIGWRRQAFGEIWAGSALADPIIAFIGADIEGDGRMELIALEGSYGDTREIAQVITVWDWNGFGFTLRWRGPEGSLRAVSAARAQDGSLLLFLQGTARR